MSAQEEIRRLIQQRRSKSKPQPAKTAVDMPFIADARSPPQTTPQHPTISPLVTMGIDVSNLPVESQAAWATLAAQQAPTPKFPPPIYNGTLDFAAEKAIREARFETYEDAELAHGVPHVLWDDFERDISLYALKYAQHLKALEAEHEMNERSWWRSKPKSPSKTFKSSLDKDGLQALQTSRAMPELGPRSEDEGDRTPTQSSFNLGLSRNPTVPREETIEGAKGDVETSGGSGTIDGTREPGTDGQRDMFGEEDKGDKHEYGQDYDGNAMDVDGE